MKKFFREFKAFITRGNIVDLAVAVVVGGAFGKIVTSLVNDVIMPLISLMVGGASVADWKWVIRPEVIVDGVVTVAESALHYGGFIQSIIDFLIISFFVFLALKLVMKTQSGFAEFTKELKKATSAEMKQLLDEGHSAREARRILKQRALDAAEAKKKEEEDKKKNQVTAESLLTEIRDLLKAQNNGEPPQDNAV